jgi:O-antigen ligase
MSTARLNTALIFIGLLAVAVVVLPYKLFELDRYFVPKELALHAGALLMLAPLLFRREQRVRVDAADMLLLLFLGWSTLSALFATNYWLAQRALGVSLSGAIVFWTARRLGAAGRYRGVLAAVATTAVVAAVTSLLQAYGIESRYFSLNRAPGGTFGNRNFIAHYAAIGLPALVFVTVTARRQWTAALGWIGMAALAATLVLSRSRAAWLAVIGSAVVFLALLLIARRRYVTARHRGRLAMLGLAALAGAAVAVILPNRLDWRSDSPYLDSARGMVDYRTGSGAGRIAQYQNSLELTRDNPVFGAGPGNWPVEYVRFAPRGDRSLTDDGMTANPWPSSDWIAFVSERGIIAAMALLGALLALFIGALRRWSAAPAEDSVLARITGAATIAATIAVSAFDAVLLLAAPAFLAWAAIGAVAGIGRRGREAMIRRGPWLMLTGVTAAVITLSLARSITQTVAITRVGLGGTRAGWIAAAPWDPGSYRIHQRVAELYVSRGQCVRARPHAQRARALFPHAAAPRRILTRCGVASRQRNGW